MNRLIGSLAQPGKWSPLGRCVPWATFSCGTVCRAPSTLRRRGRLHPRLSQNRGREHHAPDVDDPSSSVATMLPSAM
jgi:hypothetical protein